MALIVGDDAQGDYAAMECDQRGCYGHVAIRPAGDGWSSYDLACEAFDQAEAAGWDLQGRTYCPRHSRERPAERPKVGDGYSWANTRTEAVKGGQRPA